MRSGIRQDGYVNLMNKWGTSQDASEGYRFQRELVTPDMELTTLYTDNGLFTKIIDAPAEEALKQGFELGLNDPDIEKFVFRTLDGLNWEEHVSTAIKWSRLYGGSIIVMLIDDGRGLEEPLNWKNIRSIDELHVFERPVVWPDYNSLYAGDIRSYRGQRRGGGLMQPQFYDVSSIYGTFRVHASRCLVFRNGVVPESVGNENYRYWGTPEYIRLHRAIQDTVTAHSNGPKLLERSVQAVYKMKGLAQLLASELGENQALKRLELIDLARGMMNTIAIDGEGEDYGFQTFQFSGVKDVIDATCNMLSALTNIPQTILFGRSPAGENSTGESDMENWYSYVSRLQRLTIRPILLNLLDVIFTAGKASGKIDEEPDYELKFNPLWTMSDTEKATVDKTKADISYVKAQTAQVYVGLQALDPSEVRGALADSGEFQVEDILDGIPPEELLLELQGASTEDLAEDQPPTPEADLPPVPQPPNANQDASDVPSQTTGKGVGVLVVRDGKILTGLRRTEGTFCGPGGHIEAGETPKQAALRETQEEFGITPTELIHIGSTSGEVKPYLPSEIYLCTEYEGTPKADGNEMEFAQFMEPAKVLSLIDAGVAFPPFAESVELLLHSLTSASLPDTINSAPTNTDGGPGSGNFGHKGVPGQVGGSAPSEKTTGSGIEAEKDHELKGCLLSTQQKYDAARSHEKTITPIMQRIASELGCEMTGLEFSVKTASSVSDKIERKKAAGLTEDEAINQMKDIVRYTQLSKHSALVMNAIATKEKLEAQGFEITEVDNKWLKPDADYKGIHMIVVSPEGQSFELQFHSPESLTVKNQNHALYEEARKVDTPEARKQELQAQMRTNTAAMSEPNGIKSLQNFRKEDK